MKGVITGGGRGGSLPFPRNMQIPTDTLVILRAEVKRKRELLSIRTEVETKPLNLQLSHQMSSPLSHSRLLPNHCGLINMGNTCYSASVFQFLYACIPFQHKLRVVARNLNEGRLKPVSLLDHLAILFELMHTSLCSAVSPAHVHAMLPPPYDSTMQHSPILLVHS